MMTNDERIEMLQDAQQLIDEAIEAIRGAIRGTEVEPGAEAYVLPTLQMCASAEHEYLGSQPYNLDELIRALSGADDGHDEA